ncbi:MAG: C13 family peptidase [Acetobacteraceae bacterium]|nr:C13 family peptidase [Acetobacteraceae bacterium]
MRAATLALSVFVALSACAAAPLRGTAPAATAAAFRDDPRPRLWYVGLGMYDESWSENDVADLAAALERGAPGFRVIPTIFANETRSARRRFPAVEPRQVAATIADIATVAGPADVVLVYVSTHGAPGLLGRSAAGEALEPVDPAAMQSWLAPLRDHDTVLILSACFSGSFIPALQGPHRIIFAAARADRTSFGCQAGAKHTIFGDALLRALRPPRESLRTVVAATRGTVTTRERALHVDQPSLPQLSVGAAARRLYDSPVF